MVEIQPDQQKPLITKAYEAVFRKFDSTVVKYYRAERLIEVAERADQVVNHDPFTTLIEIRELGPID